MPPENKGTMGYQKWTGKPSHPLALPKRHLSGESVHSSSNNVPESKMHPRTPQRQNKTPNKSGLTPVRPTKSPGPGGKLKSGLTPIKPTGQNSVNHKSPFQKEQTKLKSGLAPLRPSGFDPKPVLSNDLNSSVIGRRKSGLLPIRPGLGGFPVGSHSVERHHTILEISHNETVTNDTQFRKPQKPGNNSSEFNNLNGCRRKSGLMPMRPPGAASSRETQWKPRFSIANQPISRSTHIFSQSRLRPNIQASLIAIDEDKESPASLRSNLSGLAPLDDSEDMSVVIRHKKGQGSSRVPLPRASLSSSHFHASDSDTSVCRIPKRVLRFDDEDLTVNNRNVLKDGSSRINAIQEKVKSPPTHNQPLDKAEIAEDRHEALLKRKKEIEEAISKLSNELKKIELELKVKENMGSLNSLNHSENCVTDAYDNDSPFANVNSPATLDPLELLPLDKSKRPENMYKLFRQSCSFLKTPQPSAFSHRHHRREPNITETPMNVSHRVQQQLADLFSDS